MNIYALTCKTCGNWCPLRDRDGRVVITCSEHGDEPLFVADGDDIRPMTWKDLADIENGEQP